MKLVRHQYGKARVRLMKVVRAGAQHTIKELEVSVVLRGDFKAAYTQGDNRAVTATDTMKNTVHLLAREKLGAENEDFGLALAEHFLKTYPQVSEAEISLAERCWGRITAAQQPHPHSFIQQGPARPWARVTGSRERSQVESGIEDLLILKTTGSGFAGFVQDKFTTLPETSDRILATRLKASWVFAASPAAHSVANAAILDAMLTVFSVNYSPSVQATLYQMGEAALQAVPEISQVTLSMPNQHCLRVNLAPFGVDDQNELFVPTDEPHGQIEGTVSRS